MDDSQISTKATRIDDAADGRFDALMAAAVDAIILIDGTGAIEEFSKAASQMFGYARQEVLGRNVKVLMPDPYKSSHDQYIENYLDSGTPKIIGIGREVQAQHKNGSVFPIYLSVGEVKVGPGVRFVGIIRDISAQKSAELEMREQREKLAHVTRLSTMGEMAAGIAHEVNQPLTAIATYSSASKRMIGKDQPNLDELGVLLDKISAQALRAGEVISRLRSFVKKKKSEYQRLDLNALVRDTLLLAEVDARHHNTGLVVTLEPSPLLVLADAVQIQQVLLNLVRNAIEAVASASGQPNSIEIKTTASEEFAGVSVIDQGPGVDDTILAELFEPFVTTKESGMGMGLSISRTIVQAHAGEFKYAPNENGGSVFSFRLPRAATGSDS